MDRIADPLLWIQPLRRHLLQGMLEKATVERWQHTKRCFNIFLLIRIGANCSASWVPLRRPKTAKTGSSWSWWLLHAAHATHSKAWRTTVASEGLCKIRTLRRGGMQSESSSSRKATSSRLVMCLDSDSLRGCCLWSQRKNQN